MPPVVPHLPVRSRAGSATGAPAEASVHVTDEGGAQWDAAVDEWFAGGTGQLWRAHSDAVNIGLLERWLPAAPLGWVLKTDLFDEAVADGLFPWLAARGARVVGVDVSTNVVEAALRHYPELDARIADVRTLPFADGEFDAVISNSTLDHFESRLELERAIAELARVLSPGGVLVVTLDNPANPIVALRNVLPFRYLHALRLVPYRTGVTCGPQALREMLQRHRLEPSDQMAVLHCPRAPAVALGGMLEGRGRASAPRYLSALAWFERLGRLPTRRLTGYYIAVRAVKLPCGE